MLTKVGVSGYWLVKTRMLAVNKLTAGYRDPEGEVEEKKNEWGGWRKQTAGIAYVISRLHEYMEEEYKK